MKHFELDNTVNNGIIETINGKNPNKIIKASKQFELFTEPFIYCNIEFTGKEKKLYKDTVFGVYYLTGYNKAWILKQVEI